VLHASLAKAGTAKVLPYLVMFATSNLGGWAGDHLIATRRASVAGARKAVNSIGARPHAPPCPLAPGCLRQGGGRDAWSRTSLALGAASGFARGAFSTRRALTRVPTVSRV